MDPQHLRTFVTVVRHASFSAAARELGYTQSAVSQHIAALETDLRTPLLLRRPVAPTEAGTRLLEHAEPLLLRMEAARADVLRLSGSNREHLLIGATPCALSARVGAVLADVRAARPRTTLTVRVTDREAVAAGVATRAFDLGLVDGMAAPSDPLRLPDTGPLQAVGINEERLVVALPSEHPLARRPALGVDLENLVDALWLDAPSTAVPLADLRVAARVGDEGFRPETRYEATDIHGLLALIRTGHGLALLPEPLLKNQPGLTGTPVRAPRLVHRTDLLHTDPGGAAAEVVKVLGG